MRDQLFFICPTDQIEKEINNHFSGEKHFHYSLGNSTSLTDELVGQIIELIETKNISKITFVLSSENQIVIDSIEKQNYSELTGLRDFYDYIEIQRKSSLQSWKTWNHQYLILSYHLNKKIEILKTKLFDLIPETVEIDAKIFHKNIGEFKAIYPELICLETFNLN